MPDPVQPFDYRTLSDMFDLAKQRGMTQAPNLSAFSQQAGEATGRPELFQQGVHDNWVKQVSTGLDRILEATGLPTAGAAIGQGIAGQVGADVGRSLPRSVLNFLPLVAAEVASGAVATPAVAGILGAAGAGTLAGAQTYTETGSAGAGLISGVGQALLPTIAHGAGQYALGKMEGVATDEAGRYIAQTLGQKAVEYGAGQTAAQGLMQVQGEAESKASTGSFYNPLDPQHLVQSIAGQLPFTVFDLLHMGLRGQSTPEKVADAIAAPEQAMETPAVPVTASETVPEVVPPTEEEKQGTLFGETVQTRANQSLAEIEQQVNTTRNQWYQGTKDPLDLDPARSLANVDIPSELGQRFQGHGMQDGPNQVSQLANLLNNGLDQNKPFHTTSLESDKDSAVSTGLGGDANTRSGIFTLVSQPDQQMKAGGIGGVLVDDKHSAIIPGLQQQFPATKFGKTSEAPQFLQSLTEPAIDATKNAALPVEDGDDAIEKVTNANQVLDESSAPTVNDAVLSDKLSDEIESTGGDIDQAAQNVTQSVANDAVDHSEVAKRAVGRPPIADEVINQRINSLDPEDPEDQSVLGVMQNALNKVPAASQTNSDYSRNVQRVVASWLADDRDGGIQKLQGNLNRQLAGAGSAQRSQVIVSVPEGVDRTDPVQMQAAVDKLNTGLVPDSDELHRFGPSHKLADGTQAFRIYQEKKQINIGSAGLENVLDPDAAQQLGATFTPEGLEPEEGSGKTTQVLSDVASQFGTAMRNLDQETLEDKLTPFPRKGEPPETDEQHTAKAEALRDQYSAYIDALTQDGDISAENVNSKLQDQKHAFGEDEDVQDFAKSPLVGQVHNYLKDNVVDLDKLQELSDRQTAQSTNPEEFGMLGSGGQKGRIVAGSGLDYGLEPIDPETNRMGKHTIGKSGFMSEDWLQKNGGTDNQSLQKGEVELYKQIVPEAFRDGGVDLKVLQKGLQEKGPVVETKTLGADGRTNSEKRVREIGHDLDTRFPGWLTRDESRMQPEERQLAGERAQLLQDGAMQSGAGSERTQYSFLGPKSEQNMPGYVEGLVRLPHETATLGDRSFPVTDSIKYDGPHFGDVRNGGHDANVLAFYRGYQETLPSGEKAFHVIEVQSDWGQTHRKAVDTNKAENAKGGIQRDLPNLPHPLVEDGVYQRLALKAAIAHAKEIGATKIILSDGETAMMTEGHDKATTPIVDKTFENLQILGERGIKFTTDGDKLKLEEGLYPDSYWGDKKPSGFDAQPAQSGGMRLAYDQTLPSFMKKLTGDAGERVELGVHKTAANGYSERVMDERGNFVRGEKIPDGSPVFRNPDGTPKTTITGRIYDLSNLSSRASKLFGSQGQRALASLNETNVRNAGLFGVKTLGAQMFKDLPPQQRDIATKQLLNIASKLRQENVPVGELVDDKEEGQLGAAVANMSRTKMGTYMLDLAKEQKVDLDHLPTVAGFVFSHENMHHALEWAKQFPESPLGKAVATLDPFLQNASVDERKALIKAMRGEGITLSQVSDEGASNPDPVIASTETMANIGASLTMKALEGDTGWLKDMVTYLPKPVGDFLMQMAEWGKRMVDSLMNLVGMGDLSGVKLSPEMLAAGKQFASGLDAYSRSNREVQQQVQQFMQLQNFDPVGFGVLQQAAKINPLFTSGVTFEGAQWAKQADEEVKSSFGLVPEKGPLGWLGDLYKRKILLPSVDAVANPYAKVAFGRAQDTSHELVLRERELMLMMGADVKDDDGSLDINGPKMVANWKLLADKDINQAFSDIGRMQSRGTVDGKGNFPRQEFQKLPSMAKLSSKAQDDALNLANIVWNMTRRDQEFVLDTQKRVGLESIGTVIQSMNKDFAPDQSRQFAGLLQDGVERLRSQDPSVQADGNQLLTTVRGQVSPQTFNEAYQFAQNERDGWERLQQFYAGDPRFMTEQRLKNFLVRFTRPDGSTDAVDSDTREGAKSKAQDLQLKGMRDIGIVDKAEQQAQGGPKIAPDGMLDKLRELQSDRDRRIAPFLTDDEKATRAAEPQIADLYQQEIAAKQMHMPGSNRQFTEGAKELNMLEGQFKFLQASLNVMGKKQIKASVALDLMDPKFVGHDDVKQRVRAQLQEVFRPDSVFGRGIAKANFYYTMAASPATAAVISMHPILSHMPYLAYEGAGIVGAGKQIASSASKIISWATNGKKWSNPEYAALMRYAGPELNASPLDEITNPQDVSLVQAARMAKGLPPTTYDKLVANPVTSIGMLSKLFFETAAKFNSRMAVISGYDFARNVKKMSIPDAQKYALDFHRTVNFTGGKANRPGIFDGSIGQTAPHVVFSLQRFNWGMIGMMGHYIKDARGNPNARRALVSMLGTQLAVGGALGLPGMGVGIGLLQQLFPQLQLQKNLVQGVQNLVRDDDQAGGVLSDLALHGVLNQMGIDMSSRVAFGSSFLGNRAYQGFSLEDAAGPTYNVLKNAVMGVQQVSEGNFTKGAADLAPNALKRLINVYTNDGTVTSPNGAPLLQPSMGQKFAMAIGFTPSQLANLRQAQQIQQRAQQVQRLEVGQVTQQATEAIQQGDYTTAKQIVQQHAQSDPTFDPVAALHTIAQHAVDAQNPVDVRRTNSNATGVAVGLVGSEVEPSEVNRLMQRTQIEQGLGLQGRISPTDYMNAFRTDSLMQQNPTMSRQQARQVVMPHFQTQFLFGSS